MNYIALDDIEEEIYKLGKTLNKKKRFSTYNSSNVNDIEFLFIIHVNNIDSVESCIKNVLKKYQYRKRKEIYKINIDALKMVCNNCDELINGFEKFMEKYPKTFPKNLRKMNKSNHGIILYIERNKI